MKKIFTFILALMVGVVTMFSQNGTCGENVTWDLTNGVLTISGTGPMTNFYWPNFGPWDSQRLDIKSIVINDGITNIGDWAFPYFSNLTSITIPNSVIFIGDHALEGCKGLISVNIPDSVRNIGSHAFIYCTGLTSITIPNSVTNIGNDAFESCKNLTSVSIGNSVDSICVWAFAYCDRLSTISIPNSVTSIGNWAFQNCESLTSVTCEAMTPPTLGDNVFKNIVDFPIPLYVPAESINDYKTAEQWKEFNPILPIGSSQEAIENIRAEKGDIKILRNGQIYIFSNNNTYIITGKEVK